MLSIFFNRRCGVSRVRRPRYGIAWRCCLALAVLASGCQPAPVPPPAPNPGISAPVVNAAWSAPQTVGACDLLAVDMVDSRIGLAVGDITTETGTIWKTTDGGLTWIPIARNTEVLSAVAFLDEQTGWVGGYAGRIERTTDGGVSWRQQRVEHEGEIINSLFFLDRNLGWAVGGVTGKSLLLRTTNGGDTWETDTLNRSENLWAIRFASPLVGWMVGADGVILGTSDGGNHWKAIRSGTGIALHGITCPTARSAIAVGEKGEILRTEDGSAWAKVAPPTQATLHAVSSSGSGRLWAVGAKGVILSSTDLGGHWTVDAGTTARPLYAIDLTGPDHGVAVGGRGTVLRLAPADGQSIRQ